MTDTPSTTAKGRAAVPKPNEMNGQRNEELYKWAEIICSMFEEELAASA